MCEVAALIADMVRAGVDADLIGRTAAALSEREPVFVPVTGATDDAMANEGHGGRSAAARRQARYRARRAAKPASGRNAGVTRDVTRYVTRDGGHNVEENGTGPDIAGETADQADIADASDRNEASRGVTGDVTRYGAAQKDTSPPNRKIPPLKKRPLKGPKRKIPPPRRKRVCLQQNPMPVPTLTSEQNRDGSRGPTDRHPPGAGQPSKQPAQPAQSAPGLVDAVVTSPG